MKIDSLYDGRFQSTRIDIAYLSILKNDNDLFALTKQNSWIMMLQKGGETMKLQTLEYFMAVAREGSVSAAAKYLRLSQPALSRQLRELEEELGKPLLIRGS